MAAAFATIIYHYQSIFQMFLIITMIVCSKCKSLRFFYSYSVIFILELVLLRKTSAGFVTLFHSVEIVAP